MILIHLFIHVFSLSSILPFSHSIRLVRPFVCPSVQLFSSFVHPLSPSIHLSLHLSIQTIHSVHPTMLSALMLSARIFICLSICPSVRLFGLSTHLSVCPSDNITVCPICLLVPSSVHLSIHTIHPFSLSGRPNVQSVHSDSAHQFICHFKRHFDPTDRNDRTSESIINKYSSQTDYPSMSGSMCSPSIHLVHPYIHPAGNSICLSICLFSPFVHRMDGRTSFSFSERKLCFGSCDLMY